MRQPRSRLGLPLPPCRQPPRHRLELCQVSTEHAIPARGRWGGVRGLGCGVGDWPGARSHRSLPLVPQHCAVSGSRAQRLVPSAQRSQEPNRRVRPKRPGS